MTLNDWILSFHLLAAFALVAALTSFWILIVALWRVDRPATIAAYMRTAAIANVIVAVGTVGTVVFGIWLAISIDGYAIWDGWIIVAIILWAIASELGRRAGVSYTAAGKRAEELAAAGTESSPELAEAFGASSAFRFHVIASVATLILLIDMIWKPGA